MTTTTTETLDERRARIHAGQMQHWENSVRYHFDNPPDTWTVRKAAERCWHLVDAAGATLMRFERKRDADTALEMSLSVEMRGQSCAGRIWRERDEWYRGTSNDPRNRALTDEEREIVARVLAEIEARPACGTCGAMLEPRAPQTQEQQFCGSWFDHPPVTGGGSLIGHTTTALIPSAGLTAQLEGKSA